MRDFFLNSFEILVEVIVGLMCLGVVILAAVPLFSGHDGSLLMAVGILVGGGLYVVLMGGILYLVLSMHDSMKRTAAAVEKMANSSK